MTITAGIVGYGNLGRSVEQLIGRQPDFELVGIFSRRESLNTNTPVYAVADINDFADQIDVLFLCLGSATDIPAQAAKFAEHFTTVDTYDNHADVPRHHADMGAAAEKAGTVAMVCTGWDPGLFSMNRLLAASMFPVPQQNTYWGPGLSQGHSDAIRRVNGVKRGVQYTIPREDAVELARKGQAHDISQTDAHARDCYIVADETDHDRIRDEIVNMPAYFEDYQTTVHFITDEEFDRDHQGTPHGGHVITTGELGGSESLMQFILKLDSNPDFTASTMIAFGRAAARLASQGKTGAYSVLEVPLYLLSLQPLNHLLATEV